MATEISSEELERTTIDKLGTDFGKLYNSLINEYFWIRLKWDEFYELFGSKQETVDLLNQTAPDFFHMAQSVFLENIMIGLTKITDPEETRGKVIKKNVTIKAIPKYIDDIELKARLNQMIKEIDYATSFCRDWRNRHITHKDLLLSIEAHNTEPLKEATKAGFTNAFEKMDSFLNSIESHYFKRETIFSLLKNPKGSMSLIFYLRSGWNYELTRFESKILNAKQ